MWSQSLALRPRFFMPAEGSLRPFLFSPPRPASLSAQLPGIPVGGIFRHQNIGILIQTIHQLKEGRHLQGAFPLFPRGPVPSRTPPPYTESAQDICPTGAFRSGRRLPSLKGADKKGRVDYNTTAAYHALSGGYGPAGPTRDIISAEPSCPP